MTTKGAILAPILLIAGLAFFMTIRMVFSEASALFAVGSTPSRKKHVNNQRESIIPNNSTRIGRTELYENTTAEEAKAPRPAIGNATIKSKASSGSTLSTALNTTTTSTSTTTDSTESKSINNETSARSNKDNCPLAVRNAIGIYNDSAMLAQNKFPNTVLLTASNYPFMELLDNWQQWVASHGLKWAVLSMDNKLYQHLGAEHSNAVPTEEQFAAGEEQAGGFRSVPYNKLVCNKIRMVMSVMRECSVDVVFSDTDNVLLRDPFQHQLGDLIRDDGGYDYIYTTSNPWSPVPGSHSCLTEGTIVEKGNTGFHYLRHNSTVLWGLLNATIEKCEERRNRYDDQRHFWTAIGNQKNLTTWHHCGSPLTTEETQFRMCCLDNHFYAVGSEKPYSNHSLVSFHATHVSGKWPKIEKLKTWVDGWIVNGSSSEGE